MYGVYFLDNAREMFGSSWDKVWPSIPYSLIFTLYLSLLCFFTHLLKFYSGGAVGLWSCLGFVLVMTKKGFTAAEL